jgi:hypothetical protein
MIDTHGGTFKALGYKPNDVKQQQDGNVRVGCQMFIEFKAHPFVDSARYGLLQMVDYQDMGAPAFPPGWPDTQARAVNPGQFIDKKQRFINPISNAANPPSVFSAHQYSTFLQALPSKEARIIIESITEPQAGGGVLVHLSLPADRYTKVGNAAVDDLVQRMRLGGGLGDASGRQVTDAWGSAVRGEQIVPTRYLDMPNHPIPPAVFQQAAVTSSRRFETAAICVAGPNAGMYLGSVEWGYYTQAGQIRLYPLRAISMGAPSASFMAAVQGWNRATVSLGSGQVAPVPIPPNDAAPVAAMPTDREQLGDRFGAVRSEYNQLANAAAAAQLNKRKNLELELYALAATIVMEAKPVGPTRQVAYQAGESLRTFAQRATGSRNAWVEIFVLNHFTIAAVPKNGDLLTVPVTR